MQLATISHAARNTCNIVHTHTTAYTYIYVHMYVCLWQSHHDLIRCVAQNAIEFNLATTTLSKHPFFMCARLKSGLYNIVNTCLSERKTRKTKKRFIKNDPFRESTPYTLYALRSCWWWWWSATFARGKCNLCNKWTLANVKGESIKQLCA